jgi:putative ABC transport system substrate-binding protein
MTPGRRMQAQQSGKVYRLAMVYTFFPIARAIDDENTRGSQSWEFYGELSRMGYFKGANLAVERHSTEGHLEDLDELARSVVRSDPDVIFTDSNPSALAFKAATTTIPIVCGTGDPVAFGIVSNLARPGGNITGTSYDAGLEVTGKYFDLLRAAVPNMSKVGLVALRATWEHAGGKAIADGAQRARISLIGPPLHDPVEEAECRRVIAAMAQDGADALIVILGRVPDAELRSAIGSIDGARLPALFIDRQAVVLGGLMSYTPDIVDLVRRLADDVGQILGGAKPGDIPYYRPKKFHLTINLKTAKRLGMDLAPSLLVQADEVIE